MVRKTILGFLLLCSPLLGDEIRQTIKPGLHEIEVKFTVTEGAKPPDVSWRPAYPIVLDYKVRTAETEGWSVLTFYARPGKYAIDSDIIDWAQQHRQQDRHLFEVEGEPEPGPEPGPTPPDPTDITGFAKDVYTEAAKIGDWEKARQVASVFEHVGEDLDTLGPVVIMSRVQTGVQALTLAAAQWDPFLNWLSRHVNPAVPRSELKIKFPQIVEGLRHGK